MPAGTGAGYDRSSMSLDLRVVLGLLVLSFLAGGCAKTQRPDWQDSQAEFTAESTALMQYMVGWLP